MVLSEPGQDLVGGALCHMSGEGLNGAAGSDLGDPGDIQSFLDIDDGSTPLADNDQVLSLLDQEDSDSEQESRDPTKYSDEAPPMLQISPSRTSSYSKVHSSYLRSTKYSNSSTKQTHVQAFREETENREKSMVKLALKKLDFKTVELTVKKQKLEVESQRGMDKERLVAKERMLQQKETVNSMYTK